MVRHRQIQTEKVEDRADQALRLTQCQPKHRPQRQGRSGRQGRIVRLTASGCARLGPPGRDGFLGEPDGQASPLAQGGVILGPIRDPVLLLGDAMMASGIDLEGYGRYPRLGTAQLSYAIPLRPPNRPFVQQSRFRALRRKRFAAARLRRSLNQNSTVSPLPSIAR
jgi:hypothetical protein